MSVFKYPFLIANFFRRISLSFLGASTLGVQALVINEAKQEVLLVHHTYRKGWYFPGGGIFRGETIQAAMRRELMEEVGIEVVGNLEFYNIYHNKIFGANDYPILFIVKNFTQVPVKSPEIAEAKWFSIHALPQDIKTSTFNRIQEYFFGASLSEEWY